jgi:hypothetical protein
MVSTHTGATLGIWNNQYFQGVIPYLLPSYRDGGAGDPNDTGVIDTTQPAGKQVTA